MKPSTLAVSRVRPPNQEDDPAAFAHWLLRVDANPMLRWHLQFEGAEYAPLLNRFDLHVTAGRPAVVHLAYREFDPEHVRVWDCAPAEISLGDFRLSVARVAGPDETYSLTAYAHGQEVVIESASVSITAYGGPSITYTYA